jgi:predicted phage tail protein
VRVTIQLPSLQEIRDDGNIVGFSVNIKFQVQYNGGGFTDVVNDTITGKTTNSYQRDYIIALTGAFPVDIRMVRVSADESNPRKQNRTFWFSFTEILDEKLRYPNSALSFLRFDSRQFQNIPTRKYLIRGIKVELPSNATVDTTTHLGRVTYAASGMAHLALLHGALIRRGAYGTYLPPLATGQAYQRQVSTAMTSLPSRNIATSW